MVLASNHLQFQAPIQATPSTTALKLVLALALLKSWALLQDPVLLKPASVRSRISSLVHSQATRRAFMEEASVVAMAVDLVDFVEDSVVVTVDLDSEKDSASAEEDKVSASAEEDTLVPLQSKSLPLPAVEFRSLFSVAVQSANLT
jgi:hypothetical protein